MPSMADRALELQASRGFYVFPTDHPDQSRCIGLHNPVTSPCDSIRGKHPAVKWKTWAPIAKAKPELLEEAFRRRNNLANIGIACGPSKLVVLDEDQFNELKRWCTDMGITLPETYTVTTGRGKHLYFFWDHATNGPISNREQAFAGYKINVRGHGGLVIGEYSKHETGVVYTGNGMPIVPLPQEVPDKLLHASGNSSSTPNAQTIWQHIPADPNVTMIADGDRHAALVAYAGRLRGKDLDYHEAKLVFRGRWLLCEQPDGQIPEGKFHTATCRYPVTWDEATAKLSSIYTTCPPGNNGSQPAPATKIDEAAFWNAYPRADLVPRLRAQRAGRTVGDARRRADRRVGHHPAGCRAARHRRRLRQRQPVRRTSSARAAPSRARPSPPPAHGCTPSSPPDPVKPGSGQGVAKCFAYVKRTKSADPCRSASGGQPSP